MSQTLDDFIAHPFGHDEPKQNDYERSYLNLSKSKRIKMVAYTEKDDKFLVHFKVGSESSSQFYDVVFLFYSNDPQLRSGRWFNEYYVKYFSNSPSFLYNYIVLYRNNQYLIDELYTKMDKEYRDKLPTKSNPDMRVSYDKSIYCAAKFMLSNKFNFNKFKLQLFTKKKSPEDFFKGIATFEDKKTDRLMEDLEKKLDKELKEKPDKKPAKSKSRTSGKKEKKVAILHEGIKQAKVIKAKKAGGVKAPKSKKRARK